MKTKLFTMMAAVAAMASVTTGCDKPDETPPCLIGRGLWVAKYTKVDDNGSADCKDRAGDILNMQKYQAFPTPANPSPPSNLAIKPWVYRYANLAPTDRPTGATDGTARTDLAFGQFTSNTAVNNICSVPTLSTASATTQGVHCTPSMVTTTTRARASRSACPRILQGSEPAGAPACNQTVSAAQNLEAAGTSFATQGASATTGAPLFDPTTGAPLYVCTNTAQLAAAQNAPAESDIQGLPSSFKFSNVEFQNDRTHGGQQMQADLEFTVGACVAHYKVLGMQGLSQDTGGPTACGEQADCNPRPTPESTDPNRFDPLLGSGINPDFPVHCDFDVGAYTDWVNEAVFNRTAFVGGFGVCMLDGPFNTTCDSSSDPDCWTKGPLGSTEP